MIDARPYDDHAALAVLANLDPMDHAEACAVRGAYANGYQLWADWRAVQGFRLESRVFHTGPGMGARPFAVVCLTHTGQAGVAQAAFLACDHHRFRRHIAQACVQIARALPQLARDTGLRRIEARSWAEHPTAPRFLRACGFASEVRMSGFGGDGSQSFVQYARVFSHNQT
jgi:hypothetical protein